MSDCWKMLEKPITINISKRFSVFTKQRTLNYEWETRTEVFSERKGRELKAFIEIPLLTSTLSMGTSHWEVKEKQFSISHCHCISVASRKGNIHAESSSMLSFALNDNITFSTLSKFSLFVGLSLWYSERTQSRQWTFKREIPRNWSKILIIAAKLTLNAHTAKSNTIKTLKLLSFVDWNV